MTTFTKKGTKTRRHINTTREFDHASRTLLPDYVQFSTWAERVLWRALINEYGEQAVLDAIEEAHEQMDEDVELPESQREQYELEV